MQDIFGPVLFGAFALVFVPLFLAVLATDETSRQTVERHGVHVGGVAVAVVTVTLLVLALLFVGAVPTDRSFVFPVVGSYLSAVGLVFTVGYTRRLLRLLRAERTETGTLDRGHVAVTGVVDCESPPESPFFETPAAVWEWEVGVKNRHGTNYGGRRAWATERAGRGGVVFTLDDGSGPVQVDPEGARFELHDERTAEHPPGRTPGRAAEVTDLGMGGERFRFTERVLRPGTTATVVGHVSATGELDASGGSLAVASGSGSDLLWGLALRAAGVGSVSLVGTWVCWRLLAGVFGVSVPF